MNRLRRCLDDGRKIADRHAESGMVPVAEFRVLLAELEAALDAPDPPPECSPHGFPVQLKG